MRPLTAALALLGVAAFALILSLTAAAQGAPIETQMNTMQASYTAAGTPEVVPLFVYAVAATSANPDQTAKPDQTATSKSTAYHQANRQRGPVLKTIRASTRLVRVARSPVRVGFRAAKGATRFAIRAPMLGVKAAGRTTRFARAGAGKAVGLVFRRRN